MVFEPYRKNNAWLGVPSSTVTNSPHCEFKVVDSKITTGPPTSIMNTMAGTQRAVGSPMNQTSITAKVVGTPAEFQLVRALQDSRQQVTYIDPEAYYNNAAPYHLSQSSMSYFTSMGLTPPAGISQDVFQKNNWFIPSFAAGYSYIPNQLRLNGTALTLTVPVFSNTADQSLIVSAWVQPYSTNTAQVWIGGANVNGTPLTSSMYPSWSKSTSATMTRIGIELNNITVQNHANSIVVSFLNCQTIAGIQFSYNADDGVAQGSINKPFSEGRGIWNGYISGLQETGSFTTMEKGDNRIISEFTFTVTGN